MPPTNYGSVALGKRNSERCSRMALHRGFATCRKRIPWSWFVNAAFSPSTTFPRAFLWKVFRATLFHICSNQLMASLPEGYCNEYSTATVPVKRSSKVKMAMEGMTFDKWCLGAFWHSHKMGSLSGGVWGLMSIMCCAFLPIYPGRCLFLFVFPQRLFILSHHVVSRGTIVSHRWAILKFPEPVNFASRLVSFVFACPLALPRILLHPFKQLSTAPSVNLCFVLLIPPTSASVAVKARISSKDGCQCRTHCSSKKNLPVLSTLAHCWYSALFCFVCLFHFSLDFFPLPSLLHSLEGIQSHLVDFRPRRNAIPNRWSHIVSLETLSDGLDVTFALALQRSLLWSSRE